MTTYFISDCHLHANNQNLFNIFCQFLDSLTSSDMLYVLGDLFDVWYGDDHQNAFFNSVEAQFKATTQRGIKLFIMQGNRDFLLGESFCRRIGATLLPDPCLIDLYGKAVVLTHGDLLCTDDRRYQWFRVLTHSRLLQMIFLALPLSWRLRIASLVKSTTQQTRVDADAHANAIASMLQEYGVTLLIHGHTHKPCIEYDFTQTPYTSRIVLSDWHEFGHALQVTEFGIRSEFIHS